jgi:O-antigen/teichoic acid export membrane protein
MQRLSQNAIILLLNNVATAVLAFGLTILISRGLGDSAFGQYAAIMAWVLPLTLVADFGLNTLITRDVAQQRSAARYYLHQSHPLRLLVGGMVVGSVWLLAPFLSDEPLVVTGLRVAILLAVIDAFFGSYTAVFRSWERFWPILLLNTGYLLLQVLSAVVIITHGGDVVALMVAIVVADIVQLLVTWLLWRRWRHDYPSASDQPLAPHALLTQTTPFVIAGVLAMLQMRVMIILLDQLLSTAAVGWYAAAFRLVEAARLAPNALFVALFPRLNALVESPQQFLALMRWSALGVSVYSISFALAMLLLGDRVIDLLFGGEFAPAAAILGVLAWTLLPGTLRALLTLYYYAYSAERWVNGCLLLALIVQIIAGLVLVPRYGVAAAGWAVIIGESSLVLCLALKRHSVLK